MHRKEMPRVYELQDLIYDRSAPAAYFQNFDESVHEYPEKRKTWLGREKVLQRLDQQSWKFLKDEAKPYLTSRDTSGRGHQQLISILNQAFAYTYLIDEGCSDVAFIPRSEVPGRETPDLKGRLNNRKVLCEVKSIGISDDEAIRRQNGGAGSTKNALGMGFLNKLTSNLRKAKCQMAAYDSSNEIMRIAFIVPDFDDLLGEYKAEYFRQIDQHLAVERTEGIDVVFYNLRTAFHCPIPMGNARVVNEQAG